MPALVMPGQIAFSAASLVAEVTGEWPVALMDRSNVNVQVFLSTEALVAEVASEAPLIVVDSLFMSVQMVFPTEPPPTLAAIKLPTRPLGAPRLTLAWRWIGHFDTRLA